MKRYFRLIPIFLLSLSLVACKGKTLLKEDIAGGAPGEEEAAEETVQEEVSPGVTDEVSSEGIAAEDTVTEAQEEEKYAKVLPEDGSVLKPGVVEPALYTVHFDYDRYNIREEDKELLKKNAQWLKKNMGAKILIEGHADERGENEYNLALGEKRARSVRNYLNALGIPEDRLEVITYGEERPLDPGQTEDAWAENRRAEFKVLD